MRLGVNASFWGMETTGSGQYLHHLVRALARWHPDVAVTLYAPQSVAPDAEAWTLARRRTPRCLGANLAKVWFEQLSFPRACREDGVDLAHVPYFAPPLRPPVPTLVTIHDLIPLVLPQYRGHPGVRAYMRLVSAAARMASLVLTDSHASAADIERLLGVPKERIRVIHLAAHARYQPLRDIARVGGSLRLPSRYLLYLGGFDCRKNVPGLLPAPPPALRSA